MVPTLEAVAESYHRVHSSVAGASRWSRWARRLGAAVVTGVVTGALVGPVPVQAQLEELFPSTSSTAPTTRPTSESTLLPPLENLATTTTAAPGATTTTGLLTLPSGPESTLLPAPAGAPAKTSRTTTFNTLPVPPRTPLRVTTTTLQGSIRPSTLPVPEDVEGGDEEAAFDGTLPFTPEDEQIQAAGLHRELGGGGGGEDPITLMASIAGGLLALVLLGVVGWLQSQVRGRPHLW